MDTEVKFTPDVSGELSSSLLADQRNKSNVYKLIREKMSPEDSDRLLDLLDRYGLAERLQIELVDILLYQTPEQQKRGIEWLYMLSDEDLKELLSMKGVLDDNKWKEKVGSVLQLIAGR